MNEKNGQNPRETYGADTHGLICGFVFGPDGVAKALDAQQALHWLANPTTQTGFIWLHFTLAQVSAEKWLRQNLALSDVFYESLREPSRSTRVELDGGTLVAVESKATF
jgi:zinc transporter